ncbi:unnamed protein product [Protopolystoma xenopodis]|uniref:Uncharacterized protein n=1 Tax=Protopolystoma xenopodis TaxID=117903 RepID=A0A3S5BCN3_9PLAT|nr:unnamed protein product [Protopolystoma xenopodis]
MLCPLDPELCRLSEAELAHLKCYEDDVITGLLDHHLPLSYKSECVFQLTPLVESVRAHVAGSHRCLSYGSAGDSCQELIKNDGNDRAVYNPKRTTLDAIPYVAYTAQCLSSVQRCVIVTEMWQSIHMLTGVAIQSLPNVSTHSGVPNIISNDSGDVWRRLWRKRNDLRLFCKKDNNEIPLQKGFPSQACQMLVCKSGMLYKQHTVYHFACLSTCLLASQGKIPCLNGYWLSVRSLVANWFSRLRQEATERLNRTPLPGTCFTISPMPLCP